MWALFRSKTMYGWRVWSEGGLFTVSFPSYIRREGKLQISEFILYCWCRVIGMLVIKTL